MVALTVFFGCAWFVGCTALEPRPAPVHKDTEETDIELSETDLAAGLDSAVTLHLLNEAPFAVALYDVPLQGDLLVGMRLRYANDHAVDLLGERMIERQGMTLVDVFPEMANEDSKRFLRLYRDACVSGKTVFVGPVSFRDQVYDLTIVPVDRTHAAAFFTYAGGPVSQAQNPTLLADPNRYIELRLEAASAVSERFEAKAKKAARRGENW